MNDLISRSALIKRRRKVVEYDEAGFSMDYFAVSVEEINKAPTVEAKPVVRGEWVGNVCSSCNLNWDENMVNNADDWGYFNPMPNFCPNCGADMRKKVQE